LLTEFCRNGLKFFDKSVTGIIASGLHPVSLTPA
jgi:hypothetical protein